MNSTTTALIFFFALLAICFAAFAAPVVIPMIRNLRAPKQTVYAEVDSMTDRIYKRRSGKNAPFGIVTFHTNDNEYPEVLVNEVQYNSLKIGERGELTYKGTRFLDFER